MAGTDLGATPTGAPQSDFAGRTLIHTPASSRTRTVHGAWALGTTVAAVYSSRREVSALTVALTLSSGAQQLIASMPPATAHAMAAALSAAAMATQAKGGAL